MGFFTDMFRKTLPPEPVEETPIERALRLRDEVNEVIPLLPKDVQFWMEWRPQRLQVVERNFTSLPLREYNPGLEKAYDDDETQTRGQRYGKTRLRRDMMGGSK